METYKAIFDAVDGPTLTDLLDITPSHQRTLRARGRIPREYWRTLTDGLETLGRPLPDGALEKAEMHFLDAAQRAKTEPELALDGGVA